DRAGYGVGTAWPGREYRIPASGRTRGGLIHFSIESRKKTCNGNTVLQGTAHRRVSDQAENAGPKALSAGADARAAVSLQSRMRRLRQDRLSRRDPQSPHVGAGML